VNIRTLRTALLIQSIEESDRAGDVLALADREAATRTALRENPQSRPQATSGNTGPDSARRESRRVLPRSAEKFIGTRSNLLLARVRTRSPAVDHILALAGGFTWLGRGVVLLAFVLGLSLSALDGSRRINILSFPLIGLVAWNLLVYLVLIAERWRHRGSAAPAGFGWGHLYRRWIGARVNSVLGQSTRFNAPLGKALRHFAVEWTSVERPLLLERAKRLMHVGAAFVALGLIAGMYIRGVGLRYEAGWESTFLGPPAVHALLTVFYGPAALISGLGLPTTAGLVALQWAGVSGGGEAASWIHLIAITAALYIVVPRLILAAAATGSLWRLARSPTLPGSFVGYARMLLATATGAVAAGQASVTAFAYEPAPESLAGLKTLLGAALGADIGIEVRPLVRYGEEEAFRERLSQPQELKDWNVLLMTLASTPEPENHGIVVGAMRDALAGRSHSAPLLVVIDSGPYASRMQGDASYAERLEERGRLWKSFIAGFGLRACIVELAQIVPGTPREAEARDLARAALWSAGERLPAS